MKKLFLPTLTFLFLNHCFAQQQFQLAPPVLQYHAAFFTGYATVTLKFAQPGTHIFYTLNNTEPTQKDVVYTKPVVINKSLTTFQAKVFGAGFLPSEKVQVTFIKDGLKIRSIEQPAANEKFAGNGPATLFDNEGGIADMHLKNFLGYLQDSVAVQVTLEKKHKVQSILLDFLQNESSWIFLPQSIRVYYYNANRNAYERIGEKTIASDSVMKGSAMVFEMVKFTKNVFADQFKIIIEPLQSIPEGHPGKGKQAWLFIDEIKIY
ncbi:MAG: chitobiase/beta-hexosaminidase C-terminal domain-containing protein [Ginsengibacter sp.]